VRNVEPQQSLPTTAERLSTRYQSAVGVSGRKVRALGGRTFRKARTRASFKDCVTTIARLHTSGTSCVSVRQASDQPCSLNSRHHPRSCTAAANAGCEPRRADVDHLAACSRVTTRAMPTGILPRIIARSRWASTGRPFHEAHQARSSSASSCSLSPAPERVRPPAGNRVCLFGRATSYRRFPQGARSSFRCSDDHSPNRFSISARSIRVAFHAEGSEIAIPPCLSPAVAHPRPLRGISQVLLGGSVVSKNGYPSV